VRDALAAGRLEVVLPAFVERRETTFRIFWASSRHPSPKVRALIDFLAARMKIERSGP